MKMVRTVIAALICAGVGVAFGAQADDAGRAYAMAWKGRLADFYYGAIEDGNGKALVENIKRLEDAWVQCNGCPEEGEIKAELAKARKAARDAGLIVPRVEMRAVIFGSVTDSYNPVVPPPSYLEREPELAVMMEKRGTGTLTQVRLKTVNEWVYHYLLEGRQDFTRKNLTDKTLAEMEAIDRAAKGIKDAYVLECSYQQGNMLLKSSAFWWDKRPDVPMDQLALIESGAQAYTKTGGMAVKFIPIGGARTDCPDQW